MRRDEGAIVKGSQIMTTSFSSAVSSSGTDGPNDSSSSSPATCESDSTLQLRLKRFFLVVLFTSLFFWGWAVLNIVTGKVPFDLGVVSFAFSALSSAFVLKRAVVDSEEISSRAQKMVLSSHLFVSFNYLLGVVAVRDKLGFQIYCGIFSIGWAFIGKVGYSLLYSYGKRDRS
eukprot:CAMPEP_0116065154 /NCGR_PEP_ID=MMETSP0322-20121206/9566_1 /TAXON_ID=163516 /ORGANISM="Leptocylindrus danicus var. apora, Strain B651" /LENGTH=172 /DNA_ID=CAMNT_0003551359 /DNA_START=91 /DNA_END=609 /DNA_ORIENTATION=-